MISILTRIGNDYFAMKTKTAFNYHNIYLFQIYTDEKYMQKINTKYSKRCMPYSIKLKNSF